MFGHAESTQGRLWVVGYDPELFDYFLPERWRHTPGKKLSATSETHYTLTKDNIHLVWKLSSVGEKPEVNPSNEIGAAILAHGFNSPFEEFSIALDLARHGIPTIYPRAIYMSGLESSRSALYVVDSGASSLTNHWSQRMPRRFSVPTTIISLSGDTGMAQRKWQKIAMKDTYNPWISA